ncbi:MAG: hypothetical protein F6J97_08170 [Leptolyngbya sp. SIO4C1]|nr:hypothetical protein [Leptolyngbya sp. SIO4C1]
MLPDSWAEWVAQIPIKSGSGIANFEPLSWQQQTADLIISSRDRRKSYIFCKSRQVGATTLVLSIVDYLALSVPGFQALFLHKTYNDASLLGYRNRKFLTAAKVPTVSDSLSRQELENGSVLYFRSSDPESCGRGLDSIDAVIFEECSFYDDLSATIGAIAPAQTWNDNAVSLFVSTPNGKRGAGAKYWELLSGGDDTATEQLFTAIREDRSEPFQILRADSPSTVVIAHWRAVERYQAEPDFKARILEESGIDESTFNQEYDLDFSTSDTESVFSFELISRAAAGDWEQPDDEAIYFAGIDSATSGADFSVCIVIKKIFSDECDRFAVVKLYRRQKGTTEQHLSNIAELLADYQPVTCSIEKNGVGQVWLEQLSYLPGSRNTSLEGFATTRDSKEGLIGRLVVALERGHLTIPNSIITQELLGFQRRSDGKLEAASRYHDDTVIALALALHSARYGHSGDLRWNT